jgi:ribosomal protein S18 acetylase RimI-like enzyme
MIPLVPRKASFDDYPQFERLCAEVEGVDVPSAAEFGGRIAPNAILLEEVAAGAVVAAAHFLVEDGLGHVLLVVVDREWRRSGVGKSVMGEVAARLRGQGCTRWWLEVRSDDVAARALCAAMGLRQTGDAGVPGRVRMEGELPKTPD